MPYTVDEDEIFRALGHADAASVPEAVRDLCLAAAEGIEDLVNPWGTTLRVGIDEIAGGTVRLQSGCLLRSSMLSTLFRNAVRLEISLVTLGHRVTEEIRERVAKGNMLEAVALDAAATAMTGSFMNRLREGICRKAHEEGLGTTVPYGPGFKGWEDGDTRSLFIHFGGRTPVRLNEHLMMLPEKSLLNVIGVGATGIRTPRELLPCRLCSLERCPYRRVPYREGKGRKP